MTRPPSQPISEGTPDDIVILIPVFNDWVSLATLLEMIDAEIGDRRARVLVVNDGSTEPPLALEDTATLHRLLGVDVLELRLNLGHQRAIAVGLSFIEKHLQCRAVVVMDGDGEDAPSDVPRLLDELDRADDAAVIFAERTKRSESWSFRLGYRAYRAIHRPLTGIPVKIGNFSVVPKQHISRLVLGSDIWNHYAAAVVRSRLPLRLVPTSRAQRIAGQSTMNVVSLVVHGLSAMAVFGDRVAVRLLAAAGAFVGLFVAVIVTLGALDIAAGWEITWGAPVFVVAVMGAFQMLALLLVFVFMVLGTRNQPGFIPLRDHEAYVGGTWELCGR